MKYKSNYNPIIFDKHFIGQYACIGIDFFQKKFISLNSNVSFINIGGKGTFTKDIGGLVYEKIKTSILFFSLNSRIKLRFTNKSRFVPFLNIGPRAEYMIKYKEDYVLLKYIEDKNKLNSILYGLSGSLGLDYFYKKIIFRFEAECNYNFNKLADNIEGQNSWNHFDKIYLSYFTLGIAVGYNFK